MTPTNAFRWLWSPIAALWGEMIGLRTEQLRSLASVAGLNFSVAGFTLIAALDLNWWHPISGLTPAFRSCGRIMGQRSARIIITSSLRGR